MSLSTLVYVSLSTRKMTDADLSELLAICRHNNRKLEITGMLLYRDGFFIQALEGEETILDQLFSAIRGDRRHSDVLLIYREAIEERAFAEWSMGFRSLDRDMLETLEGYDGFLDHPPADFFSHHPGKVKSLLYSFRTRHPLTDIGPGSMDLSRVADFECSRSLSEASKTAELSS